jgi:hypothetical protein
VHSLLCKSDLETELIEENSERESEKLKAILVLKKYASSTETRSTWKYYECALIFGYIFLMIMQFLKR